MWFRQDLRLADNPALIAAIDSCDQVLPVFIDDELPGTISQIGEASRVWLHHSLVALQKSLKECGSSLLICRGEPGNVLNELAKKFGVEQIFWNRCYDPATRERDQALKQKLSHLNPQSYLGSLLYEPVSTVKSDATPYRVFTPYWKNLMHTLPGEPPLPAPKKISSPKAADLSIDDLNYLPKKPWAKAMIASWQIGEKAAHATLKTFLAKEVRHYDSQRDIPSIKGTSKMSPHLHFGEISPRQILHQTFASRKSVTAVNVGEETFIKEVVWREFAHNLIYHFPHTPEKPLDTRFAKFPWAKNYSASLTAWQRGQTGVPLIDAGMRELYATGWMHNRVRMVVASFLIKNLLIPWQEGERWFRHTLVDADVASNAMGWQWAAGSGADAAPFFRVFNPVLQGEKFDPEGHYVRQWVPELADIPKKHLHKPWELPDELRKQIDYPPPLVDLKASRVAALEAFATIKTR